MRVTKEIRTVRLRAAFRTSSHSCHVDFLHLATDLSSYSGKSMLANRQIDRFRVVERVDSRMSTEVRTPRRCRPSGEDLWSGQRTKGSLERVKVGRRTNVRRKQKRRTKTWYGRRINERVASVRFVAVWRVPAYRDRNYSAFSLRASSSMPSISLDATGAAINAADLSHLGERNQHGATFERAKVPGRGTKIEKRWIVSFLNARHGTTDSYRRCYREKTNFTRKTAAGGITFPLFKSFFLCAVKEASLSAKVERRTKQRRSDRIATRVVKRYQAYPVYLPWQELAHASTRHVAAKRTR